MTGIDTASGTLHRTEADAERRDAFIPTRAAQSHAAFLLELANGDLLCTWFAGSEEGKPDGSIYLSRLVKGADTWSEDVKVSDDNTRSEQNPVLFQTPQGALWLLYTAQEFGDQSTSIVRRRVSHDDGQTWGPIEQMFDDVGLFIRQPILVLSTGEWLLPVFHCNAPAGDDWHGQGDVSAVKISTDGGESWFEAPVPDSQGAVHMNLIERSDGSVLGLFRSRYADWIKKSVSTDGGRTWSAPVPTSIPNNNSSIQCRPLADGTLALVFNNSTATPSAREQSGPGPVWGSPRSPLTIALSYDEGESWPHMRDMEVAPGPIPELNLDKADRRTRELSYPTVTGTQDGDIAVAYTYFRKAIKFSRFPADWPAQGKTGASS